MEDLQAAALAIEQGDGTATSHSGERILALVQALRERFAFRKKPQSKQLVANTCLYLVEAATLLPHAANAAEGLLVEIATASTGNDDAEQDDTNTVDVFDCLLEACEDESRGESWRYMWAARVVAAHALAGSAFRGVDAGRLMRLATCEGRSSADARLAFHATALLCALLRLPPQLSGLLLRRHPLLKGDAALPLSAFAPAASLLPTLPTLAALCLEESAMVARTQLESAGANRQSASTGDSSGSIAGHSYNLIGSSSNSGSSSSSGSGGTTCRRGLVRLGRYTIPCVGAGAWPEGLALTPTTVDNLSRLLQAHALCLPTVLQGALGCGKSFLLRQLAAAAGLPAPVELHLDDTADSKALVGAWVCSDVPGEFVWQAGVVMQAVSRGHWLVVENIDRVPVEVSTPLLSSLPLYFLSLFRPHVLSDSFPLLSSLQVMAALSSLIERRVLYSPQTGAEVRAHPDFRLFASRAVALPDVLPSDTSEVSGDTLALRALQSVPALRHFSQFWHFVPIHTPPPGEIDAIVSSAHHALPPSVRRRLLRTYAVFSGEGSVALAAGAGDEDDDTPAVGASEGSDSAALAPASTLRRLRQFTMRDVMKSARRLAAHAARLTHPSGYLTEALRCLLLQEVADVFVAATRDPEATAELALLLGRCWGVGAAQVEAMLLQGSPQVHWDQSGGALTVGRCTLAAAPAQSPGASNQLFALTRHACRLLERVAACVQHGEPVLLVGETGSGKTTSVQELANLTRRTLLVQNLSLSTDSTDLLGGFRPVTVRQLLQPTYELFVRLFQESFSSAANGQFLEVCLAAFNGQQWRKMLRAFAKAAANAATKFKKESEERGAEGEMGGAAEAAPVAESSTDLRQRWAALAARVERLSASLPRVQAGFAFAFVDGLLVQAMQRGHWVLLDEVNLAAPEVLQGLVGILDGQPLCLTDRGDVAPVERHPDFRLFAAMNPPTDVGKRELPPAIRCRFTEIYCEELTDPADLAMVVQGCLRDINEAPVADIVSVYLGCRAASELTLVDSGGQRPRYTLRSLTRSLAATRAFLDINFRPLSRALFEGFLLSFQTQLDEAGRRFMHTFLRDSLSVPGAKDLAVPPSRPGGRRSAAEEWTLVKPFWLRRGPLDEVDWCEVDASGTRRFVMTRTVEASIRDLCAGIAAGVAPILLQGPTSVGKTTMIEYLAARTGHVCVRINNHEHTDTQEYIGGYVTSPQGQLVFREGLLVEALRGGHWVILDELNLAPSDVLEALNRLMDDNRELYIAETGETVRPAEGFCLFATQNPAGAYGGRKPLSRAFRNRFLEIAVCELPAVEIEDIVTKACGIAPRFAHMLVSTMTDLQARRQQSTLYQGRQGAVTTRDLLKWGHRRPLDPRMVCREGYMLLAERLRDPAERQEVLDVLQRACKVELDVAGMYDERPADPSDWAEASSSSGGSSTSGGGALLTGPGEGVDAATAALGALSGLQSRLRSGEGEDDDEEPGGEAAHAGGSDVRVLRLEGGVKGLAITAAIRRLWVLASRCMQHRVSGPFSDSYIRSKHLPPTHTHTNSLSLSPLFHFASTGACATSRRDGLRQDDGLPTAGGADGPAAAHPQLPSVHRSQRPHRRPPTRAQPRSATCRGRWRRAEGLPTATGVRGG